MAPFYGWGSTASRLEPLRGGSLLFTIKFPEIPGTCSETMGKAVKPCGTHGETVTVERSDCLVETILNRTR